MQRDNGPLCAAEIGSELQKQFAILPGWLLQQYWTNASTNVFESYQLPRRGWFVSVKTPAVYQPGAPKIAIVRWTK